MKLAIVVPGGVDRSGVDRVVPALLWQIERLARKHTIHVFALDQEPAPAHWDLLGASVHNVGSTRGRRTRLLRWLAEEHAREPFDVVQAFWGGAGTYAAIAAQWHGIPFALHLAGGELVALHDIDYGTGCHWKTRIALSATIAAARRVSVASGYMQELARRRGCDAAQIPLGVALDLWPARTPRQRDMSREFRLLHIGDIRPVKDQALLLRAAALLREQRLNFRLDIAGYDTMNGEMQQEAVRAGLSSVVHWHGLLHRDALRSLVDQSDLLLVTSRHDAGPLAVLEAAVAGVPTVGANVGHVADWAPHAAASVPIGDAAALASAVLQLASDEPRRLAIAREAHRRAIAADADYTSDCFERMYVELAGRMDA